jgi:hypothetical protein
MYSASKVGAATRSLKQTEAMAAADEHLPLDYTPDWIALGIVTAADINRDEEESASGEDPHPEHYRWRAFSRFLAAKKSLPSPLAHQLFALGAADADRAMGGSIMADVLRHQDCPLDLLDSALTSDRAHLKRIVAQRLNRIISNS